jgi:hypothetical protein
VTIGRGVVLRVGSIGIVQGWTGGGLPVVSIVESHGTTDLGEARDALEAILAHDRADLSAVTQRRQLATMDGLHRAEPALAWLTAWRGHLDTERQQLLSDTEHVAARCHSARLELAALQSALNAARAAWAPYERRIRLLYDELRTSLVPEARRAACATERTGIHRRRHAKRQSLSADQAVTNAQRTLADLEQKGARHDGTSRTSRAEPPASAAQPPPTTGPRRAAPTGSAKSKRSSTPPTSTSSGATDDPSPTNGLAHAADVLTMSALDPPHRPMASNTEQELCNELVDLLPAAVPARLTPEPDITIA